MATSLEALLTVSNAPPLLLSEPTNQTSYMGAPVTLAVSASGSWPLTYQWRFNGAALAGATNASLVLSSVQLTNEGYYAATVSNAWGTATSSNVFLDVVDLGDALNTSLVWTTSGDAAWFPENQYPSYFTPAARSGSITNNQSSTIQTTVTGPGTLTFQWKVSSEPTADHLSFLVNGEEQRRISGQTYWQSETFYLGAGPQTLRWTYAKDGQGSAGQDAAWLDWVGFTQGATVPVITLQPLHQALTPGSNITFSVSAYGTPPLAYQWQCNGVNLAGATSNSLTLFNVQVANRGLYRAVVSNPYGTTISSEASLFTFVGPEQPQDALDRWYWRHPASLARVRFAGGLFIGLGNNGTLLTSPDGAVWTPRVSGTSANLTGVTCGTLKSPSVHPLFVAVGAQGTILTSPDGTNWAPVSVTTQNLNDVAWNGTRFVASTTATAPGQPNILCSTNGTNWLGIVFPNNPDTGIPFVTTSVGIAGNYFITAGGSLFAYYIWRSSNGGTWQNVGFSDQVVEGMASDGSRSIMVGWEGWPRVSADFGASWSAAASSVITSNAYQPPLYASPMVGSDIAFGNDTFVVARGHLNNGFLTTPDGQTWKQRSLFVGADIQSIAYGAGTFVVTCAGGSYPPGIYQSE
ncbi:MAG TPA: immunoglobulin domain-containing protein, partial [Candidatus Sulfotelmatobacter sp.]|nr:immunoglobulin domain-containing protein [Candidatus Sulfotelmatobacter sp.]